MTRQDGLIVLQARVGSSRLPGKALRAVEGVTLLGRCLSRLVASAAAPVVLATTTRAEDDALAREADRFGVRVLRGSPEDVLARFAMVVDLLAPRWIVRATGDNPLVDIDAPRRVLHAIAALDIDHVVERGLPVGAAVEAVRGAALLDAHRHTEAPYDREHVTPFLRQPGGRYRAAEIDAPPALRRPDLRLTVDTDADLAWVARVIARAGASPTLPLADIIRAADKVALQEVA